MFSVLLLRVRFFFRLEVASKVFTFRFSLHVVLLCWLLCYFFFRTRTCVQLPTFETLVYLFINLYFFASFDTCDLSYTWKVTLFYHVMFTVIIKCYQNTLNLRAFHRFAFFSYFLAFSTLASAGGAAPRTPQPACYLDGKGSVQLPALSPRSVGSDAPRHRKCLRTTPSALRARSPRRARGSYARIAM